VKERILSRRLSTSVVDALKAHGHILVVKGGATALAREMDELMAPEVATIEPRLKPYAPLVGEPTSTFGDETIDQAVEDMVVKVTHALMNSDHVEDVFAEDAVIRRDVFRVMRDGLREPHLILDGGDEHGDQTSVTVKLDTLGYVAATASRRTDASTLRQALDRAASVTGAHFSGFSPELREASFRLEGGSLDERLEIEEAVADELTDLVEQGIVELPTIERRIDLGRAFTASEQRALRSRIDAAAEATLLRAGCAASWDFADARTLRIVFTPLSEQDAKGVEAPTSAFARELATLLSNGHREGKPAAAIAASAPEPRPKPAAPAPPRPAMGAPPPNPRAPAPATRAPEPEPAVEPAPRRKAKEAAEPLHAVTLGNARERSPTVAPAAKTPKATPAKRAASSKKRASEAQTAPPASSRQTASKATGSTSKRAATTVKAGKAPAKKR
jgi:outer membrane biosynthesis protein TonB